MTYSKQLLRLHSGILACCVYSCNIKINGMRLLTPRRYSYDLTNKKVWSEQGEDMGSKGQYDIALA